MSELKIKAGDKIRFIEDGLDVTAGKEYKVEGVYNDDIYFTDDAGNGHYWSYPSDDYEVVSEEVEDDSMSSTDLENVKVGDKIKFTAYCSGITQGKEYEITTIDVFKTKTGQEEVSLRFYDDFGEEVSWQYPSAFYEVIKKDELSNEELTDLIVKLSKNLAIVDKRLDTLEEREDSISNDLRTLGEEGAKTAYDVEELRGKLDEHIDMFIEDISMLDERTMCLNERNAENKTNTTEEHDAVSPSHYKYGDVEVIDYIDQVCRLYGGEQAFYVANVIKYVSRSPLKNGVEDLRKARWYLDRLIEKTEQGESK